MKKLLRLEAIKFELGYFSFKNLSAYEEISIQKGDRKKVKLLKGYELYLDPNPKGIAKASVDFKKIDGLSSELKFKLSELNPQHIHEASQIDGMTPSGLMLLISKINSYKKTAWKKTTSWRNWMFHVKHLTVFVNMKAYCLNGTRK